MGLSVLTLVVVPGTACSVAPTEPPWLLRPDAGKATADEVLPDELPLAIAPAGEGPCYTCSERPCLNACPVRAFTGTGYDVGRCREHLRGPEGRECLDGGCLARRACPVGAAYTHGARQTRFHMRAFLAADPAGP